MGEVVTFEQRAARTRLPEPLWRELIGRELRRVREGRGERLRDVADAAGVSMQYLSEVERGMKDPSSEVISAVAGALGLSVLGLASQTIESSRRDPGMQCLAA